MNKIKKWANLVLELGKVRITFAVSLSTILGFIVANGGFSMEVWLPTLGIFILASGSSALNQYQEYDADAIMERTKKRPIPSGRISPTGALLIALAMIISGSFLIYFGSNFLALQLGVLALIWYNAIYTPLKRKTPFAVIPGAVIGALPPMVGWAAAGGTLVDVRIWIIAFFFFIWQIPHFWLLLMKYGKQYEEAGYPSLSSVYSDVQLRSITFVWIFATAISGLFFPFFDVVNSYFTAFAFLAAAIWLIVTSSKLVLKESTKAISTRAHFMNINIFLLLGMIFTTIDVLAF